MTSLPKLVTAKAPPIKTQGIKTKLVPTIAARISWNSNGKWIEPFLGSGAVAFNIAPERAVLSDTNEHIIRFYQRLQTGEITGPKAVNYLYKEGQYLLEKGDAHFYEVRKRFNDSKDSFDFLFLTRSCFNGVMRFNKKGGFNVPFCRKPNRFRQALITKIANQIEWTASVIKGRDWEFVNQTWQQALDRTKCDDLIYCDPPYIGRHTDYFNSFDEEEAIELARVLKTVPAQFVLSMWLENKFRRNNYVDEQFAGYHKCLVSHFYHVGSGEDLRNEMTEVLIMRKETAAVEGAATHVSGLPLFESAI